MNREFETRYNPKRIHRVMELSSWTLPRAIRRRAGRIACTESNERWCSDGLEIARWNGKVVQLGFALDRQDREDAEVSRGVTGAHFRELKL